MSTELHYGCDLQALPRELRDVFLQLTHDAPARAFVDQAETTRHGRVRTWAFGRLRTLMSDYEAYGHLAMYQMHLLSSAQWRALLGYDDDAPPTGRVLDVGAGRGDVTRTLLPLFEVCHAIEPARSLRRELKRLPLTVQAWDLCHNEVPANERYDLVTCLNVIDRVSHPKTLLRHMRMALRPGGRMVIAVPLPLRPHVDRGRRTVDQEEGLPDAAPTWELGTTALADGLLTPLELGVERVTRAPYLCRGDSQCALHVLDDVLFLCRPRHRGV